MPRAGRRRSGGKPIRKSVASLLMGKNNRVVIRGFGCLVSDEITKGLEPWKEQRLVFWIGLENRAQRRGNQSLKGFTSCMVLSDKNSQGFAN